MTDKALTPEAQLSAQWEELYYLAKDRALQAEAKLAQISDYIERRRSIAEMEFGRWVHAKSIRIAAEPIIDIIDGKGGETNPVLENFLEQQHKTNAENWPPRHISTCVWDNRCLEKPCACWCHASFRPQA